MTVVTRETLQAQAEQVRLETRARANTADRVGQALRNLVDSAVPGAPVFDVTSPAYGASPSATGAINTAAIQAAIDDAHAAGGGKVYVPRGAAYGLATAGGSVALSLSSKSNIWLAGDGIGATTLYLADGADSHLINIDGSATNIVISGMTLNGNRANQTAGVHCIRCVDVDGLWLDRLHITDARAYGIGLQGATKRFVFLSELKITSTGQDGVDAKNTDDDNAYLVASNIEIENFGLNGATPEQTGFDCRGPWQLSNFAVRWSVLDGMGIRFRGGELLDANGLGGHESSLHGFHCQGPDIAANPTSTSIGVYSDARDVAISGGTVKHTHRGVMLASASRRNSVAHVKSLDSLDQDFYAHDSSEDNSFEDCTGIRGAGFYLGGARAKCLSPTVLEPLDGSTCIEVRSSATRAKVVAPTIVGIGTPSTVVGISLGGADSQVIGGSGEDCLRAILVDAPRCKIVGFDAEGSEAEGIRVNDGSTDADDCTIQACNLTNNGTNGVTLRADRAKILGCTITGNTSNGVNVSLATCEDTTIQGTTFSGNGAALLDSGLRTRIAGDNVGLAGLVAESLDVDILDTATSANIDTTLISSKTYLFTIDVECETSGGARSRLIRRVQALRSGSGGAVVSALDTASTGTPPTVNNTASGNDLRVSVTNGLGADCHVNIRIFEERRGVTVEDS